MQGGLDFIHFLFLREKNFFSLFVIFVCSYSRFSIIKHRVEVVFLLDWVQTNDKARICNDTMFRLRQITANPKHFVTDLASLVSTTYGVLGLFPFKWFNTNYFFLIDWQETFSAISLQNKKTKATQICF